MDDVTLWVFFDPGPDSLPFACDAKSPSRFRPVRRLARLGSDRATYDGVFVGGVPNDAPSCHDSAGVIAPPRRDILSAGRSAAGGACARGEAQRPTTHSHCRRACEDFDRDAAQRSTPGPNETVELR